MKMTVGAAWVAKQSDGREHLYFASDSRTRGSMVLDCSPKILTLPRSDSAICFAGDTATTYPLMMQLVNAIEAHQPARDRSLDIRTLKSHVLRVFTDMLRRVEDAAQRLTSSDVQFIFGGYSWLSKSFEIWTILYSEKDKEFYARPANNFHTYITKAAFIGNRAKELRSAVVRRLEDWKTHGEPVHPQYEPFAALRDLLRASDITSNIGGPPQLIRIGEHMNTRVLGVKWPGGADETVTVLGRVLFDYENVDTWTLDPDNLETTRPRAFGYRNS